MDLNHILERVKNSMKKTTQAIILGLMCLMLAIGISLQIRTVNSNGNTNN